MSEAALYGGPLDGSVITLDDNDDIGTYVFRQLVLERDNRNELTGKEWAIDNTYTFDHYDNMNDMPVFKWSAVETLS